MNERVKEVLGQHERVASLRSPFEGPWRSIAKLLRPDDTNFSQASNQSTRDDSEIYDSTPLYANDALAGGIFGQLTNPVNRWFELAVDGDEDLNAFTPVKQHLFARASRILASVSPAVSNFYAEAPAWFADLGAFGMGTLSQQERIGEGRVADRAVPLGQTYIDVDGDGNITRFHNGFRWRGIQIKQFFKDAVPANVKDASEYVIVHSLYRNPDYNPRRLGNLYMPWRACYVSPDIPELLVEGGFPELPYHVLMWTRLAGRLYPTGPGHITRADNWTLQEMERSELVAGQFAAEPPILTHAEDVLTAADVVPNAVLGGALTRRGERLVDILERKQQLQISGSKSEQKRSAIRTAFLFGLMQLVNRPQMTATEFLGFQEEVLKLSAPALTRVQIGLSAFIARRDRILDRAGQMPPPPPELAGRAIVIRYVSPLAKLQKISDAKGVLQLQAGIEAMALTDPTVRDNFDGDVAARVLGDAFTNIPGVIRDPRLVEQRRKERNAVAQRDVQLDQTGKAVEIAATASHAAQAASLAGARQPAK
jgi:hypothetical protein